MQVHYLNRSLTSIYNYLIVSCQAEKTSLALQRNHPELKNIWGNLEDKITIVTPQKAEQPANLKLTLLPFQQESLFWMRKQEEGIWHGGMLAVSHQFWPNALANRSFCRTRWGMSSFPGIFLLFSFLLLLEWARRSKS